MGRFIQPDSLVQDISDPQSWNRYAYVRNNPLKYTDPSGHHEEGPTEIHAHMSDFDKKEPANKPERLVREGSDPYYDRNNGGGYNKDSGGLIGTTTGSNENSYLGAVGGGVSQAFAVNTVESAVGLGRATAMPMVPEMYELRSWRQTHNIKIPQIPEDAPGWYKYVEYGTIGAVGVVTVVGVGAIAVTTVTASSAYATAMTVAGTQTGQEIIKLGSSFVGGFSSGYYDVKMPPSANTPMGVAAAKLGEFIGTTLRNLYE